MKQDKNLYYIGYPTEEGICVYIVNDKQQIAMIMVQNDNLKEWNKTDFANGELLSCSINEQNWFLCVFPDKHEAMNNYAMFQQANKANTIVLDRNIKVRSVEETLNSSLF